MLSWRDPRAQAAVNASTMAAREPGASECRRPCNGQKAPTSRSRCCDSLYLPTILFRNVAEFVQGRTQAYTIRVEPDDTVMWRSEVRGVFYFTGSYLSFPFDVQSLDLAMSLQNNATGGSGTATVIPSASGVGLFAFGNGDDLSGWRVTNVTITINERPWTTQFDDPESRNLRTRSASGDYAPLVPADDGATPYGADLSVVQVRVGVIVQRLSLFYALGAIVPIVLCVAIALLTHMLDPDLVETRLQVRWSGEYGVRFSFTYTQSQPAPPSHTHTTLSLQVIVTLILSLTALQIVFEGDLPKSSYILPTGQMVIASYIVMLVSAFMSIVVYNVHSWVDVRSYWQSMAAARAARADLRAAAATRRSPGAPPSTNRSPSFARTASRLVAALAKGGRSRFAPAPGGRFARNAPLPAPCSDDDDDDDDECGGVRGATGSARAAAALTADAERGWCNWLAFVIDAVTLATLALTYTLVVLGIFLTARSRAVNALS